MKRSFLFLVSTVFLFFGCLSGSDTNQNLNKELSKVFSLPAGSEQFQSLGSIKPIQPGQWIVLRKNEGNDKVIFKYAVFQDAGSNVWIEIQDIRLNKEIIVQYQVKNINAVSIDGLGIVTGHYYMNGRQMDNAAMMMTTYLMPLFPGGKLEKLNLTITTPAGVFNQVYGKSGSSSTTYSFESENVSISIKDVQSGTMFYHPALPLNGLVGWNSTKDRAEVVDFGFTGASPAVALE